MIIEVCLGLDAIPYSSYYIVQEVCKAKRINKVSVILCVLGFESKAARQVLLE